MTFSHAFTTRANFAIENLNVPAIQLDEMGIMLDNGLMAMEQINTLQDILSQADDKLTKAEESFAAMQISEVREFLGVENFTVSTESLKSSKTVALESLGGLASTVGKAIKTLIEKIKAIVKQLLDSGVVRKANLNAKIAHINKALAAYKQMTVDVKRKLANQVHTQGMQALAFGESGTMPRTANDFMLTLNNSLTLIKNFSAQQEQAVKVLKDTVTNDGDFEAARGQINTIERFETYGTARHQEGTEYVITRFNEAACEQVVRLAETNETELQNIVRKLNARLAVIEQTLRTPVQGLKTQALYIDRAFQAALANEMALQKAITHHQRAVDVGLAVVNASLKGVVPEAA